ncbi:MAG: NUDIX hydrolase [Candidatus Korarchaeota archaeon]|nr:NUDIX hydrolase [Candidatus Korarchaeota archaeon]
MGREYPEHPLVGVGAVAVHNDKVLLVKRGHPPGVGLWSIPGGLVELGEKIEDAVKREFQEETGLICEVRDLIQVSQVIIRDDHGRIKWHYIILDYLVRVCGSEVPHFGSDASEARWINLKTAIKMELTPPTKKLIHKLLNMRKKKI